jgi:glycerophosphoryl diester phosphodiesterase
LNSNKKLATTKLYDSSKFEIIVHRGHNLTTPENSLVGVEEICAFGENFFIEVDVSLTQDNIPILHHDLSLDRLCGDPRLLNNTNFDDLPKRTDGQTIVKLENLLSHFPDQKFLLDLRTHFHPDFLQQSNALVSDLDPPLKRMTHAVKKLLQPEDSRRIRIVVGTPDHRIYAQEIFPEFEIDIPENFSRDHLASLQKGASASIFGENIKRLYIRFREITPQIIDWAHAVDLKIIANHAPSRRSLQNSQIMLEKCIDWGLDGLTTSPINDKFIETWKTHILEDK